MTNLIEGKIAARIAMAWKEAIIIEVFDDLRLLSLKHRALATEYIFERCSRYAYPKVKELFEDEDFLRDLEENEPKRPEFVMLAQHAESTKYLKRVLRQVCELMPAWQEGRALTIGELYQEMYPRNQTVGEHEDCLGEISSGRTYFTCRKCKTRSTEVRETLSGNLVFVGEVIVPEEKREPEDE